MKAIHKKRMRKLIEFLRKLPPKKFDFQQVTNHGDEDNKTCGTVACAIGWTPALFPDLVRWNDSTVELVNGGWGFLKSAEVIFGLEERIADSLFCPGHQEDADIRLPICSGDATPKEVAAMLEKFLSLQP